MDFCMICWIGIQSKAFVGTLSNRILKKKNSSKGRMNEFEKMNWKYDGKNGEERERI